MKKDIFTMELLTKLFNGASNSEFKLTQDLVAIAIVFAIVLSCCLTVTPARAGDMDKLLKKESKKAAEKMEKEGWSVFGKKKSLKDAMGHHYKALAKGKGTLTTIEGHGIAKDVNLAIRKSQYNAAMHYATMQETRVEGTTNTTISNSSDEDGNSHIEMESNFRSSTDQTVKSLTPSVIFYRTMKDGKTEVRSLFIVKML